MIIIIDNMMIVFRSVILSIKLLPMYAQKEIMNTLPMAIAVRYFFLLILLAPESILIKNDGVNGNVIIAARLGRDIFLNFSVPESICSFIFFW